MEMVKGWGGVVMGRTLAASTSMSDYPSHTHGGWVVSTVQMGRLSGMISKATPVSMINERASLAFYLLDLTS